MDKVLPTAFVVSRDTDKLSHDINDYPGGIIIPVDKPYRWTSADVIRKLKFAATRHFAKKNLKVGHAGTLDPLATGVLLVCIGNATKQAETLQAHDKEYIAGITFGATTPSYDLEKDIDRFFPYAHIDEEAIRSVLPSFLGEQEQIAPLFSAKSVDGVRAYELARKLYKENGGKAMTDTTSEFDSAAENIIRTSLIRISKLELLSFSPGAKSSGTKSSDTKAETTGTDSREMPADRTSEIASTASKASSRINVTDNSALGLPEATVRIACSKGTYVRAFARDLGEALDSGAHLSRLQRSRSGDFHVNDALTVNTAIALLNH